MAVWGATVSMAWARLVRTLASSAASAGVTAPFVDAGVPRPRLTPSTGPGQLVLEAGGEVDVVGAVLEQDQAGRVPGQIGRGDLVTEVARLLGRVAGTVRRGTCCPPGRPQRR